MKSLRTQAIVLRRTNYGEADRIIQFLTPQGRRAVMAKGVRREKSKLAGAVELFALSDVVIGQGKGELGIVTSARLIHFYRNILQDYDGMQFAYLALKFVARASEAVDEPEWFDVMLEVLIGLDSRQVTLPMVKLWFYLHYTRLLGDELSLTNDVGGHRLQAEVTYTYDVSEKGFRQSPRGELTSAHIKLLRLANSKSLKTLAHVGGIETVAGECALIARQHASLQ